MHGKDYNFRRARICGLIWTVTALFHRCRIFYREESMAQNKLKQMARLEGVRVKNSASRTNPMVRESQTLSGNIPGERNRIGMRKTGKAPRFKGK
jgi:hypothetical protein